MITYSPPDIFIASGSYGSIEKISVSNDTSSTDVANCSIRTRGFYAVSTNISWLIGGTENNTGVESFNHSTFAVSVEPNAPLSQIGGCSLFGNTNCYLAGDSSSSSVNIFDTSNSTFSSTNSLPVRVVHPNGRADDTYGWVIGGVETDGSLYDVTQKIDLASDTWSITSLSYTGGVAKHGSFYSGLSLYSISGTTSNGLTTNIKLVDVSTDTGIFLRRASIISARTHLGSINNALYGWSIGGYNLGNSDTVERYDFSTDTSDSIYRTALVHARSHALCVGDLTVKTYTQNDTSRDSLALGHDIFTTNRQAYLPYSLGSGSIDISHIKYVCGGQNFDQIYDAVIKFDTNTVSFTILTATINPRYSCSGLCNSSYSWISGGYDPTGTALSSVDRLDHSNETVAAGPVLPTTIAPVSGSSLETTGLVCSGTTVYQLDFTTEVWSSLSYSTDRLFQSASGIVDQILLIGGENTGVPSDSVDVFDNSTTTWLYAKYSVSQPKFAAISVSVTDKTIVSGGTVRSQINTIEQINHLAQYSVVKYRGVLPEAKSRGGSSSDSIYAWVIGGYRSSALGSVDRFDPFTDTGDAVSVGDLLPTPRHSCSYTSVVNSAERNDDLLKIIVPTSNNFDRVCSLVLMGNDTRSGFSPVPYGTHITDRLTYASRLPIEIKDDRVGSVVSALPYNSDRDLLIAAGVNDDISCITEAKDILNDKLICSLSYPLSVTTDYVHDDISWIGGGYQIQKYERIDLTHTISIVGETFYPRMGAAACSSNEFAWIGGGSTIDNIVEYFIFANDTITTGDRSNLSNPRSYLAAAGDSQYVWYFCGIDSNGLVGTIDRLDKLNDTAAAMPRAVDWPRSQLSANFLYTKIYAIGGQVGSSRQDIVSTLDPSNDTVVVQDTALPIYIAGQASAEMNHELFIFYKLSVYKFEASVDTFNVITNMSVPNRQASATTLGDNILISGGTGYHITAGDLGALSQLSEFDPSNYGYISLPVDMTYNRYNHWSFSISNQVTNIAKDLLGVFVAIGQYESTQETRIETTSGATERYSLIHLTGSRVIDDLMCLAVPITGCKYGEQFDKAYIINTQNILWKFDFSCHIPINLGTPASTGSRQASISNGLLGYYIGGSNHDTTILNYADDTSRLEPALTTDTVAESSSIMIDSTTDKCLLIGGVDYDNAWNNKILITNIIRIIDLSNYTLAVSSTVLPKSVARSAYVNSYILGGSTTADHLLDDWIVHVDITTETPTVNTSTLPTGTDLNNAIVDVQSNIVVSMGATFNPSDDTMTATSGWPVYFGESFFRGGSVGLYWGGYQDRGEDITGKIYATGSYNNTAYLYDQNTTVLSACSIVQPVGSFNLQGNCAYEYCIPEIKAIDKRYSITLGKEQVPSTLNTIIVRDYTYSDRISVLHEAYDHYESTINNIYTAFGSELRLSLAIAAENHGSDRMSLLPLAVEHHDNDRSSISVSADTGVSEILTSFKVEQLLTDRSCLAAFPDFYTAITTVNASLLIGGPITTRKMCVPAAYSLNWQLFRAAGILPILINKNVDTGSFVEILNKLIKGDDSLYDIDAVLGEIDQQFGDKDFIFSLEENRGVAADESVLIKTGHDMQVIHLLMRISGTRMWVSNFENKEFIIDCGRKYAIYGIGEVPIFGTIMYIKLILPEVLSNNELTFEFRSPHSSCLLKLLSV